MIDFFFSRGYGTDNYRNSEFRMLVQIAREPSVGLDKVLRFMETYFRSEDDATEFFSLYQEFSNNLNIQANRGFSPIQMREMVPPEQRGPMKSLTLGANMRKLMASGEIDPLEFLEGLGSMEIPPGLKQSVTAQVHEIMGISSLIPPNSPDSSGLSAPFTTGISGTSLPFPGAKSAETPISRNQLCPCGSGLKYKRCCGK